MTIYEQLKQNKDIIDIFNINNIPINDEIIKSNFNALSLYAKDQQTVCDLKKPCQKKDNKKVEILYKNGQFYAEMRHCEHYLLQHPFNEIAHNFVAQNVNIENFEGSLKEIEKSLKTEEDKDYQKTMSVLLQLSSEIIKTNAWKGLYIYGVTGVGKSYFLKALAKKFAQMNHKVIITSLSALLNELIRAFNPEISSKFSIYECQRVDVLFLDDVGVERITQWSRDDVLYSIIDYRIEHRKLTFFASNKSLDNLAILLKKPSDIANGEEDGTGASRIANRIKGLTGANVELKGKSKR